MLNSNINICLLWVKCLADTEKPIRQNEGKDDGVNLLSHEEVLVIPRSEHAHESNTVTKQSAQGSRATRGE